MLKEDLFPARILDVSTGIRRIFYFIHRGGGN